MTTVLFLLFASLCFAQTDAWERVRFVEPGRKVTVTLTSGRSMNGRLHSWSADGVTLVEGKDRATNIARSDIRRIAMPAGMSRGRRAGWAALIGGGIGAGLFGGLCAGIGDCEAAAVAAGGALYVGGIAAGIAALIPQHKEVIYTAPRAVQPGAQPATANR